jgi:hypothetical protein
MERLKKAIADAKVTSGGDIVFESFRGGFEKPFIKERGNIVIFTPIGLSTAGPVTNYVQDAVGFEEGKDLPVLKDQLKKTAIAVDKLIERDLGKLGWKKK